MMRLLFVMLGLLVASIGLSLWVAVSDAARANRSATWPSAAASIVASGVRDRGGDTKSRFCPYVVYRYTVDGVLYDSTRVRSDRDLTQCSADPQWANDIVRSYPVGRTTPAFYDPDRPANSILEIHKVSWLSTYPKIGFVATFLVLILVMRQILRIRTTALHARNA